MTTADGSPVEVYRLLPPAGEAEIVHAAIPAGAAVLDLGCGTGRIAHALMALGHPVTAVDDSPAMLARVRAAKVCSRIEDLQLDRRFAAVLLASHLVNAPDSAPVLAAVARHLAPGGRAIVEWHPPEWFDTVDDGGGRLGEVEIRLSGISREADLLRATVRYAARGAVWARHFTARRLDQPRLEALLAGAGLRFGRFLSTDHTWFSAVSGL
ncbi:class I SAM-dependent methyltransferase [Amycolatopsis alkalitolerans]|uniref:Class I SAM-dependent methyltransferase n=1 Tax=Amycolatopsis alkalitolerans TaxID=2547244 RepID=A0A5C4M4K9_9PSEU|nr:class I SAM-dependent methyltransferase [Amycolatopsis alkalitolerans]TNC26150.1 class I SAM-dependent methyltransferase [Amycolatopsis alkalitolerans]